MICACAPGKTGQENLNAQDEQDVNYKTPKKNSI